MPRRRSSVRRGPSRAASGRFVLRLPPALHAALQAAAREAGVSLNEYCLRRLTAPSTGLGLGADAAGLLARAAALFGEALVGVVVYGSWARGEAVAESDVDVLVVVERQVALSRALYRTWDEAPVTWQGRRVDPHFVHPLGERRLAGVWGEAAVDGVVLFERGLRISTDLARVRRDIAAGRLVRRLVHGQPYWTEAA